MLVLLGIAVIILGFGLRLNPLIVIALAALVTTLCAGMDITAGIAALGKGFKENRFVAIAWVVLPLIGVLERNGLRQRARHIVESVNRATAGRVLFVYFVLRQAAAMLGLTSLGGQVQMVRPLLAPMVETAGERQAELDDRQREQLRAHAAAVDNIALFFGEDVFIAIGSILLIIGFMNQSGYSLTPFGVAIWALPTAGLALIIHGLRLWWLDRQLSRGRL